MLNFFAYSVEQELKKSSEVLIQTHQSTLFGSYIWRNFVQVENEVNPKLSAWVSCSTGGVASQILDFSFIRVVENAPNNLLTKLEKYLDKKVNTNSVKYQQNLFFLTFYFG